MIQYVNETIYAYIEKKEKETLLIDFVESGAFDKFLKVVADMNHEMDIEDSSMVRIINYKGRRVQEGVTYELEEDTIEELLRNNQITLYQQDSLIIGFEIDMAGVKNELFKRSKSFNREEKFFLNLELTERRDFPQLSLNGKTKVIVRNVGQGSWNEIFVDESMSLVFDIGTSYLTSKERVKEIIGDRDILFQVEQPHVLISHWDIDHYHCLVGMSDDAISSIQSFTDRNYLPTLTSRKVYARLMNLIGREKIYPIAPNEKPEKSPGYSPLLKMNEMKGNVLYYNACKCRSRNQNAICLAIRKPNSSIILPADTHYKQISKCILPDLGFSNSNQHHLVVPHHGGRAGKFIYDTHNNLTLKNAIVSVGYNRYGHPNEKYMEKLREIGFKVNKTSISGKDLVICLN